MRAHFYRLLFIVIIAVTSHTCYAQVEWESIGGPRSSYIQTSAVTPQGDVFVVGYIYKIASYYSVYKSTNDGQSWSDDLLQLQKSIYQIMPTAGGEILAGSRDGIMSFDESTGHFHILDDRIRFQNFYTSWNGTIIATGSAYYNIEEDALYSTDDGATWNPLKSPGEIRRSYMKLAIGSDNRIYVAAPPDTLFTSTDFGGTWEAIVGPFPSQMREVLVDPDDALIVITEDDILTSTDAGQTWSAPVPRPQRNFYCMDSEGTLYNHHRRDTVYVSHDRGTTWQPAFAVPVDRNYINDFYCDAQNRVILNTHMGMYAAEKGSADVQALFTNLGHPVRTMRIDELQPGTLAVVTPRDGALRFHEATRQWDCMYMPQPNVDGNNDAGNVSTYSDDILRYDGLDMAISTDNGTTWTDFPRADTVAILDIQRDGKGNLIAQTGWNEFGFWRSRSVAYSTDNGVHWLPFTTADSAMYLAGIDAAGTVYISTPKNNYRTLFATADLGATWTEIPLLPGGAAYVAANGTLYLWPWTDDTFSSTSNNGQAWNAIPRPPAYDMLSMVVTPDGCIYTSHESDMPPRHPRVMMSCDRGVTWTDISEGLDYTAVGALHLASSGFLYLDTNEGLYRSKAPVYLHIVYPQPITYDVPETYPNPVTKGENTMLTFGLEQSGEVTLALYSTLGTKVREVSLGWKSMGSHQYTIPTRGLAAGVYQLVLRGGGEVKTGRVVVR